jgi:hypothetical protein
MTAVVVWHSAHARSQSNKEISSLPSKGVYNADDQDLAALTPERITLEATAINSRRCRFIECRAHLALRTFDVETLGRSAHDTKATASNVPATDVPMLPKSAASVDRGCEPSEN